MTESKEGPRDVFAQWMEWQQSFWTEWMKNPAKGLEAAMSMFQGQGMPAGAGLADWYHNWMGALHNAFSGQAPADGIGNTVFSRVMDASKVYTDLLGLWTKAMVPMAGLPPGTQLSTEKIKELHDQWIKDYQAMMASMWGSIPIPEAKETAESVASAIATASNYSWNMAEPVFKNMEGLPALLERLQKGETGALLEIAGLFRKNYEATIGKALHAPSVGYFREVTELINKTADAYIQFNAVMAEYEALFYNTGARASEKVFQRLLEFQGREATPETFRDFYKVWWTINEDTYHEVFLSKEFTGLLREVMKRGMLFKKWLSDLTDQMLESTNLPTKKDMDEIYRALYDLKKEVRWQRRAIREIEENLGIEVSKPSPTGLSADEREHFPGGSSGPSSDDA